MNTHTQKWALLAATGEIKAILCAQRTNGRGAHDVCVCLDSVGRPHCFASWRSAREPIAERGESRQTWRFSPKAVCVDELFVGGSHSIVSSLSQPQGGTPRKGDESRRGQFYKRVFFLFFFLCTRCRPHFNNFLLAPPLMMMTKTAGTPNSIYRFLIEKIIVIQMLRVPVCLKLEIESLRTIVCFEIRDMSKEIYIKRRCIYKPQENGEK